MLDPTHAAEDGRQGSNGNSDRSPGPEPAFIQEPVWPRGWRRVRSSENCATYYVGSHPGVPDSPCVLPAERKLTLRKLTLDSGLDGWVMLRKVATVFALSPTVIIVRIIN